MQTASGELPAEWTVTAVKDRLLEAAAIPILANGNEPSASLPPTPQVQRAEQTIGWLAWLDADDTELVWARAKQMRWKAICWNLGISRPTAHRRWRRSLRLIAARLNEAETPAAVSETFLRKHEEPNAGY
jgi:hypothetical protein